MIKCFCRETLANLRNNVRVPTKLRLNKFSASNRNHTSYDKDEFRRFSRGEVERLPFSDPYFEHLEANYLEAPLDLNTCSVSESPLLTRNNVGLGFLILNSEYIGSKCVSNLYRELLELENNVYKRFVVLTSMSRNVFSKGLDPSELHLFHDSILKLSSLKETPLKKNPDFKLDLINLNMERFKKALEEYVKNVLQLLYIIKTYRKPLIVYGNGQMESFGSNLCFISSFSSCYKHSTYQANTDQTLFNNFGSTFVLSNLRGNLGEYLLLTNDSLVGKDLIWSGLAKKFIEPSSINNIQIISDRLVELPEKYVESYINEFNINLSSPDFKLKNYESVINEHFKHDNIRDIVASLKNSCNKAKSKNANDSDMPNFEQTILENMPKSSDTNSSGVNVLDGMLEIIKKLKVTKYKILSELKIGVNEWSSMVNLSYKSTSTIKQENAKLLYNLIMEILLIESLKLESKLFFKSFRMDVDFSSVFDSLFDRSTSSYSRHESGNVKDALACMKQFLNIK
uniref:3-hydroxyisobutyryl-CoA hydrolase n=1 Tax=Theileria annulata TaxID=5874 RepID=A0A3B0MRS8_THEAN